MVRKRTKKGDINAFMGPGSEFEGKLNFTGSVRIDGRITGQVSSQGLLIIGPTGVIQADVEVERVIICGEVRGEVSASQRIELRPPARVFGSLITPELVIHEGVVFEGACKMTEVREAEEKPENVTYLDSEREAAAS